MVMNHLLIYRRPAIPLAGYLPIGCGDSFQEAGEGDAIEHFGEGHSRDLRGRTRCQPKQLAELRLVAPCDSEMKLSHHL
jgi:hypothetical protein